MFNALWWPLVNMFKKLFGEHPVWSLLLPVFALSLLAMVWGGAMGPAVAFLAVFTLIGVVLVAVYHAEVVSHGIGEPFGALVLALAVTVIEVSLIVSLMLSESGDASSLTRDTVFATIMIVCNGVIGLCLLVGALKYHTLSFRVEGTTPALAVITTLVTMTLILPDFTFSTEGPTYSKAQLLFAGGMALLLYFLFVFVQTIRHRDYFMPDEFDTKGSETDQKHHSRAGLVGSVFLLVLSLAAVVGLAEIMAPIVEGKVVSLGLPHSVVGVLIALMVLLPETIAALRTALRDQMQIGFNLAFGSAMASIGLTIPVIAALSLYLGLPMSLGLPPKEMALLVLTLFLTATTLIGGRATIVNGAVHLVVFFSFIFLSFVP
jgi:Ca2+:H+ antiporter